MEMCARRSIYLEQTSVRSPKACDLDLRKREQAVTPQPVAGQREILCPQPRRAVRTPYAVDSLERLCCTLRGEPPTPRKDTSLDILSLFFCKDRLEDDGLDTDSSSQIGFFCGSPPVRADNPLVHDVQFVRQTSTLSSPLGNSFGAKGSSARAERAPSCGKSSFGGKPVVRVEGFSCGGSKSNCVVSARA